ncbi:hypothetical protein BX661DRAFT_188362 [Kickxella alabastrina]|uniref:uncharacterized protein n=1 Tax=Kickxella alabastrina TaxID=61397 RepID=UPI002221009E|nr:uncharacterized protein BX661DRAFT_188362 [Kickxella alabastrina]KAI7821463.1 hypothetical protein BX661DRAFT_188362 [Kickxella alabastrina]
MTQKEVERDPRMRRQSLIDRLYQLQPLAALAPRRVAYFYQAIVCNIKSIPDGKGFIRRDNLSLIIAGTRSSTPDLPTAMLADLGFNYGTWYDIERLDLNHWHGHILSKPVYTADSLARLNAYLLHKLPKLISINYNSMDDRRYYTEFPLDGLMASRLSQLQEIEVFSETLERLHLRFSSAESIWSRFYAGGDSQSIEFKRLTSLVLEYAEPRDSSRGNNQAVRAGSLFRDCECVSDKSGDNSDSDDSDDDDDIERKMTDSLLVRRQCVFPKLQHLSVSKYPHAITRVLQNFDIDQIPHINIRDIACGWSGLRAASVANISTLRQRSEQRYQKWVNRLFSVSSPMTSLHLDAPTSLPVALPDIIGLTNLATLSFSMEMDLGAIPNLLSRLPRLRQMVTHIHPASSWSSRNWGVLEINNGDMLADLPPLSNSLQCLVAYIGAEPNTVRQNKRRLAEMSDTTSSTENCKQGFVCGEMEPLDIERELTWVIARVPSLTTFKSQWWTTRAVTRCIDDLMTHSKLASRFKHLPHVHLSTWKY